jgi:hypothetical protein
MVLFQSRERAQWTQERQRLVDRAIARHVGEVLALDRTENQRQPHTGSERPEPVGL